MTQPADARPFDMSQSVQRSLDAYPQMQSIAIRLTGSEDSRRRALANFGPVGTVGSSFQRSDGQAISSSTLLGYTAHTQQGYWQNMYQLQLTVTAAFYGL